MFQIKPFLAIIASMVNRLRVGSLVLTDFNVGSNVRTILEACAQEIDELYQQMIAALQAAIAQATYTSFGFTPLPAVSASGAIRVTVWSSTSPITVGLGTVFTPIAGGAIVYTATAAVVIPAGSTYVDVPVIASAAGSVGNIAANSGFSAGPTPVNFIAANNLVALSNGLDAETLAAQYVRFQTYIQSLARSTLAGVAYGAGAVFLTDAFGNVTERVTAVQVFEPYTLSTSNPAWIFQVYIYDGVPTGSGATAALVSAVQTALNGSYDALGNPIDGYKAAGTQAQVVAVTLRAVAVTAALTLAAGTPSAAAIAAVQAAWASYLAGQPISAGAVLGKLEAIAFGIAGVIDCQITTPSANIAGVLGTKVVAGTFTVSSTGGA